jgi:hypothetical protein
MLRIIIAMLSLLIMAVNNAMGIKRFLTFYLSERFIIRYEKILYRRCGEEVWTESAHH